MSYTCYKYTDEYFDVNLYYPVLSDELADMWFLYLDSLLDHSNRRSSLLIGDPGLIYKVEYSGNVSHKEVIPWKEIPGISELRDLITTITGQKFTVCVVQSYPNVKIGIEG